MMMSDRMSKHLKGIGGRTGRVSLRIDVSLEIWFYKLHPLLDATFNVSTSFLNISQDLAII